MIYKASPVGEEIVPDLKIEATESVPEPERTPEGFDIMSYWKTFYMGQAKELYIKLCESLPQATRDHLFALMAKEMASILKVL